MTDMAGSLLTAGIARASICLAILGLVSGCAGSPGPSADVPPAIPQGPAAPVVDAIMPPALVSSFPNGHAFSVGRFVSRTLETAPDGESRRWPTTDPSVTLVIRADSTEIVGDTICRRATIVVENASGGTRQFPYRACRRSTGMWIP